MILMCSGIYAAIIVVFCVGISLHFLVKYQRKSKIFIEKQPKRCRIPTNATPFW